MANNPYVNKVVFGSATLVDLTGTTATADKILSGYGAFGADGAWMDGTASSGGSIWQDANGYVHLSDDGTLVGVEPLTVTENGTYTAPTGKAYSPVTVNVSGGGSATATLTYSAESSTRFNLLAPIIVETYAEMSGVPELLYANTDPRTVDVLLYNGASFVRIDNTVTSMSGDIEQDDPGYYFITGDCSITIS